MADQGGLRALSDKDEEDSRRSNNTAHPSSIVDPPADLWQTHSDRLQYEMTVGSRGNCKVEPDLQQDGDSPSMGKGRSLPPKLQNPDDFVVEFDEPVDLLHPFNWKVSTKLRISCILCLGTFQASFASASLAPGTGAASSNFGVSTEVGTLGTSLFVLGFASGPMIWAPASELIGRSLPLTIGLFGDSVFLIASAVAKDIQTLIICRFFSGLFAASQLSIVPAVLADIFDNVQRGRAMAVYSLTVFGGPFVAPIVGGFIIQSALSWRWTLYVPAIMGFLGVSLMVCFLPETYAPVILTEKARKIRRKTSNWAIHAKQEEVEFDVRALVLTHFLRPLRMLFTEPVLLFISLYMSMVYGLVYGFVEAVPYVFENVHGMNPGVGSLPFIGLIIGQVFACSFILSQHSSYTRKLLSNGGIPVPEWRLSPTPLGGPLFAIGLFWFSWTGFTASIPWIVPTAAGVFIGFGILCIFLPCFNYLVDAYLPLAASAVAANIMARSAVAAGFPLFTKQMYENLGIQWAGTLLGYLAALMIPIPLLLRACGPSLRERSPYYHKLHPTAVP